MTKSSVTGGIFGAPDKAAPPTTDNMTKSSVDGGIFGGYGHVEPGKRFAAPAPKVAISEDMASAGQAMPKPQNFSLFEGEGQPLPAALQPLPSARSNPNKSSISGGIFVRRCWPL